MAVVIETTIGDITVDLYTEERPQTCKNFLKLCKMKYYNFCLFHSIQANFIAQTGDPTGVGTGGESVFGLVYGTESKYYEAEKMPKIKHSKPGLLSMVNCGNNMLGSQFFVTLGADLQSLEEHCVFAEVTEGRDILIKLNDAICDTSHRPYQDIRITHTVILDDPFEDLPGLIVPLASPDISLLHSVNGRIGADEKINDEEGLTEAELHEAKAEREAKARATILEIVGDLPDADIAPPENVLFVCKLNPVTTDDDLEIIFGRFGKVKSCEVIRDHTTGDSLQYAFVEFEDQRSCEQAYLKMDNVLIDDRRIHVDFSQSVSKIKWKGKGRGVQYLDRVDEKDIVRNSERYTTKRDYYTSRDRERDRDRDRSDRSDRRREDDRRRRGERETDEYRRRDRRKGDEGRRREDDAWREDDRYEEDRKRRELREERRREEERNRYTGRRDERRRGDDDRRRDTDKKRNGTDRREKENSKRNEINSDVKEDKPRDSHNKHCHEILESKEDSKKESFKLSKDKIVVKKTEEVVAEFKEKTNNKVETLTNNIVHTPETSKLHLQQLPLSSFGDNDGMDASPSTLKIDVAKSVSVERKKKRRRHVSSSSGSSSSETSVSSSSSTSLDRKKRSKRMLTVAKKYYHKGKLVKIVKKKKNKSSDSESFSESSDSDRKRKKSKYKKIVKVIKKRRHSSEDSDSDSSSSEDSDDGSRRWRRKKKNDKCNRKKRKESSKRSKKKKTHNSTDTSESEDEKDRKKSKVNSNSKKNKGDISE